MRTTLPLTTLVTITLGCSSQLLADQHTTKLLETIEREQLATVPDPRFNGPSDSLFLEALLAKEKDPSAVALLETPPYLLLQIAQNYEPSSAIIPSVAFVNRPLHYGSCLLTIDGMEYPMHTVNGQKSAFVIPNSPLMLGQLPLGKHEATLTVSYREGATIQPLEASCSFVVGH